MRCFILNPPEHVQDLCAETAKCRWEKSRRMESSGELCAVGRALSAGNAGSPRIDAQA